MDIGGFLFSPSFFYHVGNVSWRAVTGTCSVLTDARWVHLSEASITAGKVRPIVVFLLEIVTLRVNLK